MRFCTTHRACEYGHSSVCEVVAEAGSDLPTCTLVDALIIPKEDGEWPGWALGDWMRPDFSITPEMLDALAQSKEGG